MVTNIVGIIAAIAVVFAGLELKAKSHAQGNIRNIRERPALYKT